MDPILHLVERFSVIIDRTLGSTDMFRCVSFRFVSFIKGFSTCGFYGLVKIQEFDKSTSEGYKYKYNKSIHKMIAARVSHRRPRLLISSEKSRRAAVKRKRGSSSAAAPVAVALRRADTTLRGHTMPRSDSGAAATCRAR